MSKTIRVILGSVVEQGARFGYVQFEDGTREKFAFSRFLGPKGRRKPLLQERVRVVYTGPEILAVVSEQL